MEESSIIVVGLKNPENRKNGGRVRYRYELRKNLALRKFPLEPCISSSESIVPEPEDPPKASEESTVLRLVEPLKGLGGEELVGSLEAPKPETQNSPDASMKSGSMDLQSNVAKEQSCLPAPTPEVVRGQIPRRSLEAPKPETQNSPDASMKSGSIDLQSNVAKEQSCSPAPTPEAVRGQIPRRYPSRVRVSAVRNIPNGHGKGATNNSKKDSPKTSRHSPSESASDEKAQTNAMESQTMSGKIEMEVKVFIKKRKKEEDWSPKNEAGENLTVDQEASVEGINHSEEIAPRQKVKETLLLFETIYRNLLLEEEAKTKKCKQALRADMLAYKIFNERNKEPGNGRKYFGNVPGIEVGDEFNLRVELCIIGLHRQHRLSVDFTNQGGKSVAVSIVCSRPYADGMRNSDVLVYSNYYSGQNLDRANVALRNSINTRTPVRVIHCFIGYPSSSSRETKAIKRISTYIYDGLYLVEKYWRKKDNDGRYASMFRLKKISGQPALVVKEVNNSKKLRVSSSPCMKDISEGNEKMPIRMVNTIDDESPRQFKYITKMLYPSQYSQPPPKGCDCTDGCSDSESCACAVKNGGEIPFNCNGDIVAAKPLVYECGPSCKCPPSCHNRVSQHGIKFRLEIFKTESRGWGVRCRDSIPCGSFVCEYAGELLDDEEAQKRTDDDYLFAIGNNYYDESLWEGLDTFIPDLQKGASGEVEEAGFAVDASESGNVGRFINHSCTPNLFAQNLLHDHDNKSMPHVVLFAQEDIPPLQELTYDYNYAIDQVHDSDGNIKKKNCYCGSIECTGRLY